MSSLRPLRRHLLSVRGHLYYHFIFTTMAFVPTVQVAAPASRPVVDLLDELDTEFGYLASEADMGYWSSDREAGMDWDLPQASGVYESEEDRLYSYFDGMSTFDADDYEYQQQLLY